MDEERLEEKYMDVLQNIEFGIVQADNANDDLTDLEVLDALDALMKAYAAEANGRPAPFMRLSPLKQKVYDSVRGMCEWRLGRNRLVPAEGEVQVLTDGEAATSQTLAAATGEGADLETSNPLEAPEPKTPEEIVACLKRIRRSVRDWNNSNGRRGYLEFVRNFAR